MNCETIALIDADLDIVMLFGFLSAFCTAVVLLYRREIERTIPALAMCFAACAVYGLLRGVIPLAIILLAAAVREGWRWYKVPGSHVTRGTPAWNQSRGLPSCESRLERMFGPR